MLAGWRSPDRGALFVVSGPSGVGKSTLVRSSLDQLPGIGFSVSATTRDPRPGEADGVDYHFVQRERFEALLGAGAFLEHAVVYDHLYGTPLQPTQQALEQGRSLLLDIDVRGAAQVRERLPESVHLFVAPPSMAVLEQRLRARGTDSDAIIERRMSMAAEQLAGCGDYDYLVVNEDLHTAQATFLGILLAELSKTSRRRSVVERFLRPHRGSGSAPPSSG